MTFDFKRLLIDAHDAFPELIKDAKAYNYNYVKLDQLVEKLYPVLRENGFFVRHAVVDGCVETAIVDMQNDCAEYVSRIPMADDLDPQDAGKAITYYRRYNLLCLLDLLTEDNDAADVKRRKSSSSSSEGTARTRTRRTRRSDSRVS